MPLIEDRIKVGRCYRMTIGGKLIVAKVIQIYPLDIGVRKNPVKEECRTLGVEGRGRLRKVDGVAGMATSGLRLCGGQRNGL